MQIAMQNPVIIPINAVCSTSECESSISSICALLYNGIEIIFNLNP